MQQDFPARAENESNLPSQLWHTCNITEVFVNYRKSSGIIVSDRLVRRVIVDSTREFL